MANIAELNKRYSALCTTEDNKDRLIKDLLGELQELDAERQTQKHEIDDQKRITNSFRDENERYKADLATFRRDKDKLSYISVLVDGDGMNFEKAFVQRGKDGGHEAARALIRAVDHHVQTVSPDVPAAIVYKIRVYAHVNGLTDAYRKANILSDGQKLEGFIHGFNQADEWCDFVDVGPGKECTDNKLKAVFKDDIHNIHCRRVIFCASADGGYATILRQYQELARKISLVKGPPFCFAMGTVAEKFTTTEFPDIFMSTKLMHDIRPQGGSSMATPANYASAVKKVPSPPPSARPEIEASNPPARATLSVCLNSKGERVDQHLRVSKESVNALKTKKLCNRFHILRACHDLGCPYTHEPNLSSRELNEQIYIARSTPCVAGPFCRNVDCIAGHRCAYGTDCKNYDCKFEDSMHHDDKEIMEIIDRQEIV
ncbi:CCCH zinc finger DNA binding protein [Aspergillus granulosus]|uniref:CCCH zinc finger DNA binding protein n=1 Tax=Aspergillus granulosus TaxID=176169 RepID=A0ABR4GRF7_9EURO